MLQGRECSVVERNGVGSQRVEEVWREFEGPGPQALLRTVLLQPRLETAEGLGVLVSQPALRSDPSVIGLFAGWV